MDGVELGGGAKFVQKENVLAVFSHKALKTVSSAIFNGGCKQVHAVLNVGVPEGYNDLSLHLDPLELITSSAAKLDLTSDYLAMVTAANVKNYSQHTKKTDDYTVTVFATAGCKHGESSGEEMDVHEITGTINIIVFINGNPSQSCMVAALITATEAKSAALRDLDVRSRYTGDSATGSITDSVTVAATGTGNPVVLGGPASKLGKLVGACTRAAVHEALLKQEPFWGTRTVVDRLAEHHLSLEKLAAEVSKIDVLTIDAQSLAEYLGRHPRAAALLLAAAKMDEDYQKGLLPKGIKGWAEVSGCFGIFGGAGVDCSKLPNYASVDLPPFIRDALINIVENAV